MKKIAKFLCVALVFCLMIPATMMLAGCGEESKVITVSTFDELKTAINGKFGTVQLLDDIKVTETLKVTRKMTLDMNGKTISNETEIWNEDIKDWSIISVRENGDLIIKGNGKIKTLENDCYCVDVCDGGKLIIEDGEFIGNISAIYAYQGSVEIKGGKYSIQQLNNNKVESEYGQTVNIYNNNKEPIYPTKATVSITGGQFYKFDPANKAHNPHDDLVATGYKTQLVEGTEYYEVVAE